VREGQRIAALEAKISVLCQQQRLLLAASQPPMRSEDRFRLAKADAAWAIYGYAP
jgi:hypothetical protein